MFLGGLKEDVEDDEIRSYFSQFGTVAEVTRLTDKDTGKKKGFGFVEFDDYDPVDKVLLQVRKSRHICDFINFDSKMSRWLPFELLSSI